MLDHWATCLKNCEHHKLVAPRMRKISRSQSGPVPDPDPTAVCPSCLPWHSMPSCVTSTQSRGLLAIPGGALNEKSQGLWCIWYTGSFVSWKTKTDFKVLLPWSKKTSVRLSQTACATTTDQPYIVEQSTFSRPPNSIPVFWITIYLDGS